MYRGQPVMTPDGEGIYQYMDRINGRLKHLVLFNIGIDPDDPKVFLAELRSFLSDELQPLSMNSEE